NPIHSSLNFRTGGGRCDWHRNNDFLWILVPQSCDSSSHRRASCQTVIDEDYATPNYLRSLSIAAILLFTALQLVLFLLRNGIDLLRRECIGWDSLPVQNSKDAGGYS